MNFLRSGLFSDVDSRSSSEESTETTGLETSDDGENEAPSASAGGWSFGGLVKSLGKVSGEVLQAYKQDLSEFADGLKKESEMVAGVTVHAVKDLPHTLETSAVVAQESLESVGQSLEEFGGSIWRGTSELIASVKDAVQKVDEEAVASSKAKASLSRELSAAQVSSWKYSRYEAQVNAMQRDSSTYCDEPEDEEDYAAWRSTFNLGEKKADIEALLKDNAFMQELETRIVPLIVEYDSFWTRYFFRLHKLQQVEDARADLVKRATSSADEEELSWDVEEESEEVRAGPEEGSSDSRSTGAAADEVPVVGDKHKEHTVHFDEESSGASSPSGGRKSEQGEITPEHPGGGHDEESISEGSTGSDWLVVQDDNQGVVDTPDKTASIPAKDKESLPAVLARRNTLDAEEPELEEIGDLTIEDTPKDQTETSTRKTVIDKKPAADEPEDWGDWE